MCVHLFERYWGGGQKSETDRLFTVKTTTTKTTRVGAGHKPDLEVGNLKRNSAKSRRSTPIFLQLIFFFWNLSSVAEIGLLIDKLVKFLYELIFMRNM